MYLNLFRRKRRNLRRGYFDKTGARRPFFEAAGRFIGRSAVRVQPGLGGGGDGAEGFAVEGVAEAGAL